jgi:hypothetical protein
MHSSSISCLFLKQTGKYKQSFLNSKIQATQQVDKSSKSPKNKIFEFLTYS